MARPLPPQCASAEEALAVFDALDAVSVESMLGAWRGEGWPSGHPLDGVLESCGWHGKRFDSAEQVHPLVFRTHGGRLLHLRPAWVLPAVPLALRLSPLRSRAAGRLAQACLPVFATRRARARLRLMQWRGRTSATMVYDDVPILDVFRAIDADTVMGLMDLKGMARPYFFLLRRQ